jgi:hypothetical protein
MFEESTCEVIVGCCYNMSFDYDNGLKNYLDTNYAGTYQCLKLRPHSYQAIEFDDDEDSQKGNMIATMRNIITNETIELELYNDRFSYPNLFYIKITPEIRQLQFRHHNYYSNVSVHPSIRDRGEEIFKILIAEQQMEDEVSPNVKQVIQNKDLNRYLMGFI